MFIICNPKWKFSVFQIWNGEIVIIIVVCQMTLLVG